MKHKVLGILTPIILIVFMFFIGIIIGLSYQSSDGWAALGAVIMVLMLTGVILIITLIAALVVYVKKKSDYALGILYGIGGLVSVGFVFGIISNLF